MTANATMFKLFRRCALFTTLLALCVVVLGAYVRLSDAGLGCPDWPGCYGALSVPQSEAALLHAQTAYPDKPLQAHKAWKEMAHRYLAGSLGLMILVLFLLAWMRRKAIQVSPWLLTLLLLLVIFQAMLGMWTVTLQLKPVIVTAHLLGGMTTLGLLTWVAHRHWGLSSSNFLQSNQHKVHANNVVHPNNFVHPNNAVHAGTLTHSGTLRFFIRGGVLVMLIQIFLGGWTSSNYAALACTDFPTCHGTWLPAMDFASAFHVLRELGQGADGAPLELPAFTAIQWSHRLGALITFAYLGMLALCLLPLNRMRAIAIVLLLLLIAQVAMGIANLVLHLPLGLAVGHNLGAALLVVTVVVLNSKVTGITKKAV